MTATGYGARVDALLDRLGSDLTEQDFASLALACHDQSGLPVREQAAVRRIVDAHADRYEPASDGSQAAVGQEVA